MWKSCAFLNQKKMTGYGIIRQKEESIVLYSSIYWVGLRENDIWVMGRRG